MNEIRPWQNWTIPVFVMLHPFIGSEILDGKFLGPAGRFDGILNGSPPGIQDRTVESNRARCKTDCEMNSVDFEESPMVKGYDESVVSDMLSHMKAGKLFYRPRAAGKEMQEILIARKIIETIPDLNPDEEEQKKDRRRRIVHKTVFNEMKAAVV